MTQEEKATNELYPIFIKPDLVRYLVIGGGMVAYEKVSNLLKQSPAARLTLVTKELLSDELRHLIDATPSIRLVLAPFSLQHLQGVHLVIAAVGGEAQTIAYIRRHTRLRNILLNVADQPQYCDFYMGSVVTKGSLKIAISTNGKSPTLAKRLKETLSEVLPDDLEQVFDQLSHIRQTLKGQFAYKVRILNQITKAWMNTQKTKHL